MKWNASAIAALLLLAGCGGGRGYSDIGLEPAAMPQGSVAARSWRGSEPAPAPQPALEEVLPSGPGGPQLAYESPGASFDRPGPAIQSGDADPTATATGPRGTSGRGGEAARYDEVVHAGVGPGGDGAVTAAHRSLPADTVVEVTSLATGRTILVLVTGATEPGAGYPIELSAGAARELGQADAGRPIPVRVRKVSATPPDVVALRSGRAAAARPDTPPVLLNALRRHLPAATVMASPTVAVPATRPSPVAQAPRPAVGGRYFVQVAALSNGRNALALAKAMGGFVKQGGGLHRVQLGPFATQREAELARAGAARAGYGDARVLAVN